MRVSKDRFYQFGEFSLDPVRRLLFRRGKPVAIRPKEFDTLAMLVMNPGRVVTKTELNKNIFSDTAASDTNIRFTLHSLRKTLDEDTHQKFIKTIRGGG